MGVQGLLSTQRQNISGSLVVVGASLLGRTDIIGVVVGIIGIVLAFIFYSRSKEKARPVFVATQYVLIGASERELPSAVEVRYNGHQIPTLCKYTVSIWNGGTKTLDQDDVAPADPITFHFIGPGTEVLDVRSVRVTRSVLNVTVAREKNDVIVSFDFLDRDDGATFDVFYSGEETSINCSGTIKGVRKGVRRRTVIDMEAPFVPFKYMNILRGIFLLINVVALLPISGFIITYGILSPHQRLPFIAFGMGTGMVAIYATVASAYRYVKERIPRSLRKNLM